MKIMKRIAISPKIVKSILMNMKNNIKYAGTNAKANKSTTSLPSMNFAIFSLQPSLFYGLERVSPTIIIQKTLLLYNPNCCMTKIPS